MTTNLKNKTKIATAWNLAVLYKNAEDPQIEQDIELFEQKVLAFEKRYRNATDKLGTPAFLKVALAAYEALSAMPEASRAGYYFGLRRELNAKDDEAEKRLNLLSDRLTKIGNKLVFFDIALGKISPAAQKIILKDTTLASYHYHLKMVFENAKHNLTEAEEKILSLKSNTSRSMWVAGTDKILNRKNISWKGADMPFSEALERISEQNKKDRNLMWTKAMDVCKDMAEIAENELTAIVLDKKINDELRGFAKPYSATLLGNENTEPAVEALIETVKSHYGIAHRFYRLKAKMLKEKKLSYADRNATVGKEAEVSFEEATETLRDVFENVNPTYRTILDTMLAQNRIDVFPKTGKTGGAFCASIVNLPTYVLLNYIPKMRAVMTYAHEMGHAVHAERSKLQPTIYQGHSTAVAETASTLFENLMFDRTLGTLSKKEKIVALHNRIQDDISTIMRQVAFFEFERDMHATIRTQGAMSHTELAVLMQKHLKSYLGSAVDVTQDDGYTFVYVSHFRNFFYVYTYVYGLLVSSAIAERIRANPAYAKEVDTFLTAGCSKSPEDIFKGIGIDTTDPNFFELGLKRLNDRITELESLVD